ncbi:hypothetical protein BLS_000138 [Venturia inaequalis]|uniref:Uncharacterized protein n=1 Tax=Venturia inaequalis TaxID=5025 RepID=A0A8H3Z0R2_VENIN|nr:hypothetical protein EG328_003716 [Venturia inaequalis]KAE9978968.1 hypothetical protein BLS_000138 [Venturia inaequalis]KAE9986956.1 hypothetical protein EG327_004066 [Venturia inaequalis]
MEHSSADKERKGDEYYNSDEDEEDDEEDEEDDDEQDFKQLVLTPLQYLNPCPDLFSPNKPPGYPHIIKTSLSGFHDETDQRDLRAVDGVATFFWNWKPEEARKFFDLSRYRYEFAEFAKPSHKPLHEGFIIARVGKYVTLGFRCHDGYGMDWEARTDFTIAQDGKWTAVACSETTSPERMEKCGGQFAAQLFWNTRWKLEDGMQRSTLVSMTKEEAEAIPEKEEDWESSDSDDSYVEPVYYPTVKKIYDS